MPNRILREGILTSEAVNELNWAEEVFYRRLMSVVDDFGRFYASPKLLRAACYPLHIDKVSDSDIGKWLTACVAAALVRVYPAPDGKRYLEVLNFKQQIRAKDSKFPSMNANAEHMRSECAADAKQMQANEHLDGGGGGDVFEDVGDTNLPAREVRNSEKFRMQANWKPSPHFATLAHQAGLPMPESQEFNSSLCEFIAYWLSQNEARTQHEWDHALLKSLKVDRSREQAKQSRKKSGGLESFAQRDAREEIDKWEQMTGRIHPSRQQPAATLKVVETTAKLIGGAK